MTERRFRPSILFLFLLGCGAVCPVDKSAGYVETIPGVRKGETVKFEMVSISGSGDIRPFWIGKFEVTWDEYNCFAFPDFFENPPDWTEADWIKFKEDNEEEWLKDDVDTVSAPSKPYEPANHEWGGGRRPAIKITRRFAGEYCKWLSRVTEKKYRLPTEKEWELACGAAPSDLDAHAWHSGNSGKKTHEAGSKKPNACGLHDMLGNAMEYVLETTDPPKEGTWFATLEGPRRRGILKGGCWKDAPEKLLPRARQPVMLAWNARDPQIPKSTCWHYDGPFVGFRVVCTGP